MGAGVTSDGTEIQSRAALTPLQAARHLGITPELLAAYSRPFFRKGDAAATTLLSISIGGRTRYAVEDLDQFDADLREPWSASAAVRPAIPAPIIAHLRAESLNQCARCGSGASVQTAHIEPWAATRSHHHDNLLRLCVACHNGHDVDGTVPTTELIALKRALVARTRAALDRRMAGPSDHLKVPRPSSSFRGRITELDAAVVSLRSGGSLLVNGAGGIGKTELLLQALARAETGRPVLWIDVGRYGDAQAIEEALQIAVSAEQGDHQSASLASKLDKLQACVVLDGIEQGALADLESLERRMAELSSSTHNTQFVATSQIALHRLAWETTLTLGPLDDASSEEILRASSPGRSGGDPSNLLRLCEGHALTLRLASALIVHFGTLAAASRVIAGRGAKAVNLPGVSRHDRTTSLAACLSLAFDALTPAERKTLLLICMAPAGLFAKQLEDNYFDIDGGLDAIATLRQWHLVRSDRDELRERLQTLSPIRMFVSQHFEDEDAETLSKLKLRLLTSIGITVPDLWQAIRDAFAAFTPTECRNYITAAGYDAYDPT